MGACFLACFFLSSFPCIFLCTIERIQSPPFNHPPPPYSPQSPLVVSQFTEAPIEETRNAAGTSYPTLNLVRALGVDLCFLLSLIHSYLRISQWQRCPSLSTQPRRACFSFRNSHVKLPFSSHFPGTFSDTAFQVSVGQFPHLSWSTELLERQPRTKMCCNYGESNL